MVLWTADRGNDGSVVGGSGVEAFLCESWRYIRL